MNLEKIYLEEDLFPKYITSYETRNYGFLFFNEKNKDSFDSNHALIYKDRIHDIDSVLNDIIVFYRNKGIRPTIYQSISDEGFFDKIGRKLSEHDFEYYVEKQNFMILSQKNAINPNARIIVRRETEWKDEYGVEIFEKSGEPWEIDVTKRALRKNNTLFFVAYYNGKPVGMTRCHFTDYVCRVDYLLVSKEFRNIGVGRTIIYTFVEYCRNNKIDICYLWPDGKSAEKIYYEAGFRHVETKQACRAIHSL